MLPVWLRALSYVSLIAGLCSALLILFDLLLGHRQKMKIMNVVWPVTALYLGPLALWAYAEIGREGGDDGKSKPKPFWQKVGVSVSHCGAGCTLGDIIAEWVLFIVGFTIAGSMLWSAYVFDYAAAFTLGIAFQYLAIVPMKGLSAGHGLWAALKADTLSLTAFEVGLFGWMALMRFVFFAHSRIDVGNPVYWFMMQVGMGIGFLTSYPVNWWLVRMGIKEAM